MAVTPEQLDDLVELTHNRYIKQNNWVDLSLDKQHHCITRFFDGKKMPLRGTPKVIWKVQVENAGTARWTGLFDKDTSNVKNQFIGAEEPWAIQTSSYEYDLREPDFQGADTFTIVDVIKGREHGMYNNMFELFENALWTAPTSSTQDPRPMNGIPFWLQKNATLGFTGGDPSGFSGGAAGISTSTYTRWKNFSGTYSAVSRDDFIDKVIQAMDFTKFKSPHSYPGLHGSGAGKMPDYEFWTTHTVLQKLRRFLDTRNENLTDVAGMAVGRVPFMGVTVDWVPALSHSSETAYDSTNPFYAVNWNMFKLFFMRGWDMKRSAPDKVAGQHNVRRVALDSVLQLICTNRREAGFVLYQA